MSTPTDNRLPPVGMVIERLRQEADLGVVELAERVGVSRESVRKWLRGTAVPSSAHARAIAVACGRNPGYLLQYASWEVDLTDPSVTERYLFPAELEPVLELAA